MFVCVCVPVLLSVRSMTVGGIPLDGGQASFIYVCIVDNANPKLPGIGFPGWGCIQRCHEMGEVGYEVKMVIIPWNSCSCLIVIGYRKSVTVLTFEAKGLTVD